ncbi:Holliday junction branch migration protein RuvA [uncultured Thiodictyon sp.]|uniref:Holliday junction branch migration protein RuvA n=1 Tax=uncultured Thiodictyon sp. TaxID=1846217 RepID=UPI0025F56B48|nr:Holliday junction branch migration protein RuvA [uncultured Thiodictyon sp.]
MIGRLRGQILVKQPPHLLLDVNGVGYELEAPMSTFYELPPVGDTVTLVTHLVVREDAHCLYGFARVRDRDLFRALLKVSGIGARIGLAILSGMDAARFVQCVEQEDITALTRVPGIGTKTAQRLVVELRDRLDGVGAGFATVSAPGAVGAGAVPGSPPGALADAVSALIALGYKQADANRMARAADDGARPSEEIIRAALRAVNPT